MLGLTLKKPSTMRLWLFAIATVALVAVAYVLGNGWWKNYQVRQELSRLRAAGIPTTAEELNDYYAVPAGEPNATAAWLKPLMAIEGGAIGRYPYDFPSLTHSGILPPRPGDDWPDLEQVEKYITDHQKLFDAIDAATASQGECCFIDDFSGGGDVLLPHTQWGKNVVRLLALRAHVRLRRGDMEDSVQDIEAMFQTSEAYSREPGQVTQRARNAMINEAVLALKQLLPALLVKDAILENLQERVASIDTHEGLRLAVVGDRVMGLTAFRHPDTAGAGRTPTVLFRAWVGDHPIEFLNALREIDAALGADWPDPLRMNGKKKDVAWKDVDKKAPWGRQSWFIPTKWTELLVANIPSFANTAARIRAATAGIAAVRFHDRHGHWPESLDELVPEFLESVPLDPFTGKPLKFVADGSGVRIYSVGRNGTDDGGVETPEETKDGDRHYKGEPDVVFSVRERPVAPTKP